MPDGVILIQVNDSPAPSPSTQPPSPSAAAWRAAAGPDGPEPVSRSSSEESLVREEASVLKHGFWGLIVIGAITGLSAGFLTGATGRGLLLLRGVTTANGTALNTAGFHWETEHRCFLGAAPRLKHKTLQPVFLAS